MQQNLWKNVRAYQKFVYWIHWYKVCRFWDIGNVELVFSDIIHPAEISFIEIEGPTKEKVEEVGQKIFELVVNTASGNKSKSEINGYGDEEFNPWQVGVVM